MQICMRFRLSEVTDIVDKCAHFHVRNFNGASQSFLRDTLSESFNVA